MADARRRMRLTWTNSGVSTLAELLDDEAPQTCKTIWDLLPLEQPASHSKYSNAEIVVPVLNPVKPARENRMQMPLPDNTLPMMGGRGPFGELDMGGMFTVLKIREGLARGDYTDPGWYRHPAGSVAHEFTGELPAPSRQRAAAPRRSAPPLDVRKPDGRHDDH